MRLISLERKGALYVNSSINAISLLHYNSSAGILWEYMALVENSRCLSNQQNILNARNGCDGRVLT
jgi:hypothetical protein